MYRAVATVSCSCGAWCSFWKEDEPCWGKVAPRDMWEHDGDIQWIHACEGHDDLKTYVPLFVDNPKTG